MLKKIIYIYSLAFVLNWVWENLHSPLYLHYQGGSINSFILFRAALVDAAIILAFIFIAQKVKLNKPLFLVLGWLVVAVIIEIWALQNGRWAYSLLMPIVPVIKTGLTPTIQLAVTGYITNKFFSRYFAV